MSVSLPDVDLLKAEASMETLEGVSVLVVDEDPAFALGLKTFLKEYVGFKNVLTAKSGSEALKMLGDNPSIEIVTLDYQMPGMNGIEVLRRLHSDPPHSMTVTMITGYPSDELEDEFRKLSNRKILATHFIAKPVDFEELEPLLLSSHRELVSARELAKQKEEEAARKEAEARAAAESNNKVAQLKGGDTESIPVPKSDTQMLYQDPTGPISPIAAAALLAHRDPTEPVPIIETTSPEITAKLEEMSAKMAHMENEVNRINAKTPTVQERFWLDILKIAAVAAIAFIGHQFGVFGKIGAYFSSGEAAVTQNEEEKPAPVSVENTTVAIEEGNSPTETPAPPANAGGKPPPVASPEPQPAPVDPEIQADASDLDA